jgi:hypothetical protein
MLKVLPVSAREEELPKAGHVKATLQAPMAFMASVLARGHWSFEAADGP